MRRTVFVALVAVGVFAMAVSAAFASNPHFKRNGSPTCAVTATSIDCSGALAGLGNEDVFLQLDTNGEASFNCISPGQSKKDPGSIAPGANKVLFSDSASETIPSDELKNGSLSFSIEGPGAVPTATAEEAGCPNGTNWTTRIAGLEFQSISLTIEQPEGTNLFICTASGPFNAGDTVELDC